MACILHSEDDANILELMALMLTKAGHTVTASSSNIDVLKRLGLRPENPSARLPDLVILDIMTPKVDGYSAARIIRDHPRIRALPNPGRFGPSGDGSDLRDDGADRRVPEEALPSGGLLQLRGEDLGSSGSRRGAVWLMKS